MAYNKVNWTVTKPINTSNLNHMDEGIANAYGEELYNGEGTTSTTLSKNVSLFKRIKIGVISSDGHTSTIEIINATNSSSLTTSVMLGSVSGTTYYGKAARILINETALTVDRNSEIAIRNNNTSVVSASDNAIRIYYVSGYYE